MIRLTGKFHLESEMGVITQLYFLHAGKQKGWKTFKNQGRVVLSYQWLVYILCDARNTVNMGNVYGGSK